MIRGCALAFPHKVLLLGLLAGVVLSSAQARSIHRKARAVRVKAQIRGLVDKSSQAAYVQHTSFGTVNVSEVAPYAAAFSGIVVNETWAQLEPGTRVTTASGRCAPRCAR